MDQPRLGRQQFSSRARSRTEKNQKCLAHHPRTFSPLLAAHHGLGSIGAPSFRNSTYSTGLPELDAKFAVTWVAAVCEPLPGEPIMIARSEEHTSELQSHSDLV